MSKALIISTNYGTETDEILRPLESLRDAGVEVTVAAAGTGGIRTLTGDRLPGVVVDSDITLAEAVAGDYDALVIPGGTLNADALRIDGDARRLVADFAAAGKPVAAICHGPWLLVDADLVVGKSLTSYVSVATDIVNAGGDWEDREVVVDVANGFPLITSRTPDDLPAFNRELLGVLRITGPEITGPGITG
ncbi:type 1 glutamine amidotransferase domain-containing protein [uncultured Corynebacterium sp.]|uniref:type 1 glutamine amidotransferase domain-containing protein n=1 Tax=uncultured Corynebacterium sp. TaxID=159447 RepID=UPI0025E562D3|nr:type 1 glutamine amidotransferase domain-containing protein [uncultured Corynebacterium sp.]